MKFNFGVDKDKWENFWYYYKLHVIAGVFILFVGAFTLKDCLGNVRPDLNILYYGQATLDNSTDKIKTKLDKVIIDINKDKKKETSIICTVDETKLIVTLAADDAQIMILNRQKFDAYAAEGGFKSLDDVVKKYGIDIQNHPEIKVKTNDSNEEHIYGIPVGGNKLLEESGLNTKDMYMVIKATDSKKQPVLDMYKNADLAVEEIMKNK